MSLPVLAREELPDVFSCLGRNIRKKLYAHPASWLASDADICSSAENALRMWQLPNAMQHCQTPYQKTPQDCWGWAASCATPQLPSALPIAQVLLLIGTQLSMGQAAVLSQLHLQRMSIVQISPPLLA